VAAQKCGLLSERWIFFAIFLVEFFNFSDDFFSYKKCGFFLHFGKGEHNEVQVLLSFF